MHQQHNTQQGCLHATAGKHAWQYLFYRGMNAST
jgi:hypothetical protein